jgi:hypothetical protein
MMVIAVVLLGALLVEHRLGGGGDRDESGEFIERGETLVSSSTCRRPSSLPGS